MGKWLRWIIFGISGILFLLILYVIFNFVFLDFFVNLWWFGSLHYKLYYLMRFYYKYLIFSAVLLFFFLVFFLNFWIASRYLGDSSDDDEALKGDKEEKEKQEKKHKRLLRMFRSGSLKIYTPLSIVLAFPIAVPFYEWWEKTLLYFFAPASGAKDVEYGIDISFYLFSYPVYKFLKTEFLIVFLFLFLFLFLLYFIESRVLGKKDMKLPKGAKIHLTLIAFIVILIQTFGFFLQLIDLLYTNNHEPIFGGPGFVEMWLDFPLICLTIITFLGTAIFAIIFIHKRKGLKVALVMGAVFLMVLGARNTDFFRNTVEKLIVKPNEVVREKKYMESSVKATLNAYGLDKAKIVNYHLNQEYPYSLDKKDLEVALRNVPVWDRELLDDVYKQLQGIRTYYGFPHVDEDRYDVGGVYQQVNIAARELILNDLPESARNWINLHLQYTHGYGVVMTPAAQGGDEPMTWFIRDIPVASDYGFSVSQPRIYYGMGQYPYALVPNDIGEIDHPKENSNVLVNYDGKGGIPISSLLKKLLFWVYFKDKNIFFTTKTTPKSRILIRRNITEAIKTITPFFELDKNPYIVTTSKGLYWILDAYTMTDMYPNAHLYKAGYGSNAFYKKKFNYIRNSVKIVVDAYNGYIDYYLADPSDPIVRAYQRMYPGLIKNMDKMPDEIKKHLRYPKQLFNVQMSIFAKYHQTDPDQFYQDEDTWELSKSSAGPIAPYYLTINMQGEIEYSFLLLSPLSPVGRDNLRALATVGCDKDHYGKITIFSFPRGQQVFGPYQVEALVNQDSIIAQELTLWDQAGSEVRFGRMIVLPVSKTILYIQPVYLISSSRLKIPELKRIIVSQGDMVAMERTIEDGLKELGRKLKEREERIKKRLPAITGHKAEEENHKKGEPSHENPHTQDENHKKEHGEHN